MPPALTVIMTLRVTQFGLVEIVDVFTVKVVTRTMVTVPSAMVTT